MSFEYGGAGPLDGIREFIEDHAMAVGALLLVAILVIVYLVAFKKEAFNPTRTMGFQERDGTGEGFAKRREHADASSVGAPASAFGAQADRYSDGSSAGISHAVSASNVVAAGVQLSPAAQEVLSSADFACDSRKDIGADAWAWMAGTVTNEGMSNRPKNDNDFSRIITGN